MIAKPKQLYLATLYIFNQIDSFFFFCLFLFVFRGLINKNILIKIVNKTKPITKNIK